MNKDWSFKEQNADSFDDLSLDDFDNEEDNDTITNKRVFNRQQLYDLVWKEPLLSLSKKYQISDVGLRKICLRLDIPLPKNGHWAKFHVGKLVITRKLSKSNREDPTITLFLRTVEDKEKVDIKAMINSLQKQFESDPSLNFDVTREVIEADPLIVAARNVLSNPKMNHCRIYGLIGCSVKGQLDINIGMGSIDRALKFMNAFLGLLKQRGHTVNISGGKTYVVVGSQEIRVYLREKLRKEILPGTYGDITRYIPTGILCFKASAMFSSEIEWRDGKLPIEQQLSKILAYIEAKAKIEAEKERIREIERKIEEEKRLEALALRERKEAELLKFKNLLAEANRWHQCQILRNYIDTLESSQANVEADFGANLVWMRNKADWFDPLKEEVDELLAKVDRNSLKFREST